MRALLAPRRLLPIVLVSAPMIVIQWRYSRDGLGAPVGIAMCVAFVLVAPLSWRVLFPEGIDLGHGAIRLFLYAAIGAGVVLVLGSVLPTELHMRPTLMTARTSLPVCCALFLVGGWGLGRDIGFELSLHRERRRADVLQREAEHAQLLAIRSHLDPHFLFNTLNAIAEWCREDGEVAERAVLQLSGILRAVLAGVKAPSWSLGSELDLVRDLFALHLLRDPALFTLVWDVPSPLPAAPLLPMILLPLAENAIKHGPAAGHRGVVRFELRVSEPAAEGRGEARLQITLENPGAYAGPRAGSDGLPTVERRLALAYGGAASIRIEGIASAGGEEPPRTRVRLELPCAGPARGVTV